MEIYEALQQFGLDQNEAKVYLSCLQQGTAIASAIAKFAHIPRASIYDILERLIQKGMVNYTIQQGKKYFSAAEPKQLIKILDDKKQSIQTVLKDLNGLQKKQINTPKIEVYQGKEGLKTVFNEIIRTKKTIYAFGSAGLSEKALKWDFPKIIDARIKAKIKFKVIFDKSSFAEEKKKLALTEVRLIAKAFEDVIFTEIYGNKTAIFIYTEQPSVVVITSNEVAKSYKKYFGILWKSAQK